MHRTTIVCILLLATAGFGNKALAQDQSGAKQPPGIQEPAPPEHFFRLDFLVEDLSAEGKVVNSRSYSTTISTSARGTMSIRSGSKIPIVTGSYSAGGDAKGPSSLVNTQFQYEDVGADFDIRNAHEVSSQLAFDLTVALSSVAAATDPNLHEPVIRENKWQASVLIPIGKPSNVFSSDAVDSKGSTRVLVTATSIQ
ncbi:MAG: hypothetical protein WBE72_15330 [Terracidiphilus sp.]